MEADGREQIETVADYFVRWDDYYRAGTTFSATSTPDSRRYDGSASDVSVANIPSAGTSMTFTAGVGTVTPDKTPPVVTVAGVADDGYVNHDVTLALTGSDEPGGSGVVAIVYQLDDGDEQRVPGATAAVVVRAEPNGPHTLVYHAVDVAGNAGDSRVFRVTCDTVGPAGSGRDVAVRKGRSVSLRYLFRDALSPWIRNIGVTVRSRTGRVVWRKSLGAAEQAGGLADGVQVAAADEGCVHLSGDVQGRGRQRPGEEGDRQDQGPLTPPPCAHRQGRGLDSRAGGRSLGVRHVRAAAGRQVK